MFEKQAIEITCPKCGHKSEENVGRLKTDGYTCPNCGYNCDPNELARAIKEVEDSVEKLKRQIARSRKTAENG